MTNLVEEVFTWTFLVMVYLGYVALGVLAVGLTAFLAAGTLSGQIDVPADYGYFFVGAWVLFLLATGLLILGNEGD